MRVGGLNIYNQIVINKYIKILQLLKEAMSLLKGKGKTGVYNTIWEVIPIFNWLI